MVAHVTGGGVEFLRPKGVSEATARLAITGFSSFGLVKPISRTPAPINGLVLLFHQIASEQKLSNSLYLLLLPRNVIISEVIKTWKKRSMAQYIETLHDCELVPNQTYSLKGDPVQLVQPEEATFLNFEDYDNYCASFEAHLDRDTRHVVLCLQSSASGWRWLPKWFLKQPSVVWKRTVQIQGAVTLDTKTEHLRLKDVLLDALNRLTMADLRVFQTRLSWLPEAMPRTYLEEANSTTTVDRIVQYYLPSRAKKITIDTLRQMGFNDIVDDLESEEG